MRTFQYEQLKQLMMPMETVNLIAKINEYKGKQELYKQQAPQILETLKDVAVIQSTKASNAIEGIIITDSRLKSIMQNDIDLKDRSEGEIAGYRDVLQLVHSSYDAIPIRESVILQLHKELYRYNPIEGGRWKNVDNVISETFVDGTKRIRFQPLSAFETPTAMQRLCEELRERMVKTDVEPLILISIFILDFLSVHPFNDGNGRMARLLTLLLLYKFGYEVGRYISLEKIIEESKEDYYESLRTSSIGWHENKNNIFPWLNYLLGTFIAAYKDLESRVGIIETQIGGKSQRIHDYIEKKLGYFTKADIRNACPDVSEATINRVLNELKVQQVIEPIGLGRNAKWRKL
ncbi:Fic family protein [Schinkia azotoformans]|uniref:Filamentation induced by cAMP protein fic n=1 Tax=Schinkia azotoformans LMG 9581 TaxID=1131731 RepID=K6C7S4_SCHAZ|nr:Fic family protein [Schinkia azotoformans]EKN67185.1 filamentation induced by cAMP protein fic [Schinkia azotoformans LMG 9581]MEC1640130.1 Fic family protein [Schinkia azotoformans]MEC1722372.1 Fic family protein [Schinkia azotoformans]MEC1945563.1 Fic family protein [Schinkia azotoformans]MED4411730.1 Fic family protein [Schinkia azotoformans]